MDDLNGECFGHHEEYFPSISASDSEHEYMKEFLLEPNKPTRGEFGSDGVPTVPSVPTPNQHLQSNLLYGNNMMANPPNCFESNGRPENMLPMGIHDPNALTPIVPLIDCRNFIPNASPSGIGMQVPQQMPVMPMAMASASPSGMPMAVPSPVGMNMPSPGGMNMPVASPGMGMPVASPSGMVMGVPSPSAMGMSVNSAHSPYNPSPVMGMPSPSMSGVPLSPMGIPSVSPGSLGMSNASPGGMPGLPSASPSGRAHPSASASVVNMSSTSVGVSPLTAGPSRSPYRSSPSQFSVASPSGLGVAVPSSSPSRQNISSASPGRANYQSASPGRANVSNASPGQVSVPGTSPSHVSMPSTSPGRLSVVGSSPMVTDHADMNGASYSASCSSSSSPAGLERLPSASASATVERTDPDPDASQAVPNPDPNPDPDDAPANPMSVEGEDDSDGSKKDKTQIRTVRRKTKNKEAQLKKRKDVRAQRVLSDPREAIGASSLYDLLPQDNPASNDEVANTSASELAAGQATVKSARGRKRRYGDSSTKSSSKRELVTYHSQISSQNGIKLKIKKATPPRKPPKPRNRKRRPRTDSDSDEDGAYSSHRRTNYSKATSASDDEVHEQSGWGERMPTDVLHIIFKSVTHEEGCVPFLVRMTRVCKLWRSVAITPDLWHTIELSSTWVRDRAKNLHTFRWLCENRLTKVKELNLGGWKFSGIPSLLDVIANNCVALRGLNLTGWQGLHIDDISFLVTNCKQLERIDLSQVNPEAHNNKGAVSLNSLQNLTHIMGPRLTHLILANNKLAGVPQIIASIATYCQNLQVLDMSNVRTVAHATAQIHIERLQEGCPNLRVLRITNSQFALAPASIKEQVQSPGFPELEELSVASPRGRMDSLALSQPFIDDDALGRILKSSLKLRLLDVRGSSRITDSSLVRIPAWDLEHLHLSGCYATRLPGSGLELITQKWGHSLIELDLGWSSATEALDLAVQALADKGAESPLRILNLCGSSVSLEPVKAVLLKCHQLCSLNLASCRALPRGMKRKYEGIELIELRSTFEDKAPPAEPAKPRESDDPPEIRATEPVEAPRPENTTTEHASNDEEDDEIKSEPEFDLDASQITPEGALQEEDPLRVSKIDGPCEDDADPGVNVGLDAEVMTPEDMAIVAEALANTPDATPQESSAPGSSTPGTPGPSGTPGTPSTPGTMTTTSVADSELMALASDVKSNLDNHLGYSPFSELDCGSGLP